jgi:imidazolonepropionase-like amidohydrolase
MNANSSFTRGGSVGPAVFDGSRSDGRLRAARCGPHAGAGPVLALRAGRLFDGWSARLVERPLVLIEDGRITAIESGDVEPPPDAEVVDLGEVTLLPGLIDTHVHLGFDASAAPVAHLQAATDEALLQRMRANAATALAAGITTVRDLGDRAFLAVALRESLAAEPGTGPEIIAAGPPLTSPGGHCYFMGGEVAGEDGIRRAVRESVARGADLIKIMATGGALTPTSNPMEPQFTVDEVAAAVHEAHELGRPVTVHAHATVGMRLAVDAGADGIEHGMFWVEDGVRIDPALVDRIAENETWICPTAGIRPDQQGENRPPPAVAARLAHFPTVVAALHAAGVRLVAGSDSGIAPVKPHDVLPYSIRAMATAGMSNLAALRSATAQAALACRVDDRKGRLAPGKDADILAVAGDPLTDLHTLDQVRAVYRAGHRVR